MAPPGGGGGGALNQIKFALSEGNKGPSLSQFLVKSTEIICNNMYRLKFDAFSKSNLLISLPTILEIPSTTE